MDGSGIRVGIISDSFNSLGGAAADIENGELPGEQNPFDRKLPVTILSDVPDGLEITKDEGRALAQIVYDIAPGSELLFHTAIDSSGEVPFASGGSFSKAVKALREADVDVIFDDIILLDSLVEYGIAAQAIDDAVSDGIVYLSASGNNGSIAYESSFRKGESFSLNGLDFETHDFDPGLPVDSFQKIDVAKDGTLLRPLFSSYSNDNNTPNQLSLLLLDSPELPSESNIKAISFPLSTDTLGEALSAFIYSPKKGEELYYAVVRDASEILDENLQVRWVSTANGLDRDIEYEYVDQLLGTPTVYAQANSEKAITVGSASDDGTAYDSFASRGGIPILFDDEGNLLPEPIARQKPDVIGPDNLMTAFPEGSQFNPFIGTSAAVAYVAGVVALMEEAAGGPNVLPPETIKAILGATDKPVEAAPGLPDSAGFVQPDLAVFGAKVAGQLALLNNSTTLTLVTGDTSSNSSPSDFSLDSTATGGESTIISEPTDQSNSNNSIALPAKNTNSSNAETTSALQVIAPDNNPAVLIVTYDSNGEGYWRGTSDSDVISCGTEVDRIFAGGADDIVTGNKGDDAIDGGDESDTLRVGKGQDLLIGGNGDDFLCGDFGTDTLTGGSGADTFAFQPETATPVTNLAYADIVQDFNVAQGDKIGLTAEIAIAEIMLQVFDSDGDSQTDANLLKLSSNNGDRILPVVLETIDAVGQTTLTNADFIGLPNNIL